MDIFIYVDDIKFIVKSNKSQKKIAVDLFLEFKKIANENGLQLNQNKTYIYSPDLMQDNNSISIE